VRHRPVLACVRGVEGLHKPRPRSSLRQHGLLAVGIRILDLGRSQVGVLIVGGNTISISAWSCVASVVGRCLVGAVVTVG
jgi:hypothetical protein